MLQRSDISFYLCASGQLDPKDTGRRSNEIVAERNKMTVKQVQRYIKLNDLVPDLQKMMDAGQIKFTPAVELAYMMPKKISGISMVRKSAISGMFSLLMVKASPAENSEAK